VFAQEFPGRLLPDGRPVSSFEDFVEYLQSKPAANGEIMVRHLPFAGKNKVRIMSVSMWCCSFHSARCSLRIRFCTGEDGLPSTFRNDRVSWWDAVTW
jgi:hypothetical protein